MIGVYVAYVWQNRHDDREIDLVKFYGFLTFKYRENKDVLGHIGGL